MEKKAKVEFSKMTEIFNGITSLGQCVGIEPSQESYVPNYAGEKPVQYDENEVFDRQQCEGLILNVKSPG